MLELSVKGSLGKFSYLNLTEVVMDSLLITGANKAMETARAKAPFLSGHPIHLRDTIKRLDFLAARYIKISTDSPYAFVAEFGTRLRKAAPYIRPAKISAQRRMKSAIRKIILDSIKEEQK